MPPVCRENCADGGNIAIVKGDGMASSAGDGKSWNGSANASLTWMSKYFCTLPFTGWCVRFQLIHT